MSNVFIALQANDESRPLAEAIVADNPHAVVSHPTGLIKIDCPDQLVLRRETVETLTGMPFDLQRLQINLVTLSGHVDEDDDEFKLSWKH